MIEGYSPRQDKITNGSLSGSRRAARTLETGFLVAPDRQEILSRRALFNPDFGRLLALSDSDQGVGRQQVL
jgi:hypothetical protein